MGEQRLATVELCGTDLCRFAERCDCSGYGESTNVQNDLPFDLLLLTDTS
jgi:hypothetical protein